MPDWEDDVRRFTAGVGVDRVLEVGGPETFARAVRVVRPGGTITLTGYLGGTSGKIEALDLFWGKVVVRAAAVGSRASFLAMNRALIAHAVHPVIDRVLSWTEIDEALAHLAAARHVGKIALTFNANPA